MKGRNNVVRATPKDLPRQNVIKG